MKKLTPELLRQHKGVSFVGVNTCFFCHDGNGKFVLALRSKNARDEHGTWEIGGGGLKWGALAEDNMRREVLEEYGAKVKEFEFLGYRDVLRTFPDGTNTHWVALDFAALVDPKQVHINEPENFDDIGWFTLKNLPSPLHSQQTTFFNQYSTKLKQILA